MTVIAFSRPGAEGKARDIQSALMVFNRINQDLSQLWKLVSATAMDEVERHRIQVDLAGAIASVMKANAAYIGHCVAPNLTGAPPEPPAEP